MPTSSATNYHYSHESGEILKDLIERVQDDSHKDMTWRVRHNKRSEVWDALVTTPDYRIDTYTIRSTGFPKLVRLYYKAPGAPRKGGLEHIASVETFALAVMCAEDHHRRITNGRRADAKNDAA